MAQSSIEMDLLLEACDRLERKIDDISKDVKDLSVRQAVHIEKVETLEECTERHEAELTKLQRVGFRVNLLWGGLGIVGTGLLGMALKACV